MEEKRKPLETALLKRLFPYISRYAWLGIGALLCLVIVDARGCPAALPREARHRRGRGRAQPFGPCPNGHSPCRGHGLRVRCSRWFPAYGIQYLGQRLLLDLRMDLFRKVLSLSNDYFDRTPVGNTLTNLSNDLEALREFIAEGIVSVAGDLLKVGFILVAMLLINFTLALVAFITIPLFLAATFLFRASIRSGFRQVRKANGEINVALSETISGVREIHQFGYEKEARTSFARNNTSYRSAYLKVVNAYALFFPGDRDRHQREHDPDPPGGALPGWAPRCTSERSSPSSPTSTCSSGRFASSRRSSTSCSRRWPPRSASSSSWMRR